jgi:hypothetical protein
MATQQAEKSARICTVDTTIQDWVDNCSGNLEYTKSLFRDHDSMQHRLYRLHFRLMRLMNQEGRSVEQIARMFCPELQMTLGEASLCSLLKRNQPGAKNM